MKPNELLKRIVVVVMVFQLAFGQAVFAATTDKDLTLDDNTADSPLVIMRDQDENIFTLQKLDAGAAELTNNEGGIDFKPSGDIDDYLQFLTIGNSSYLYWLGVLAYTNAPGLRVDPATGKLEYRDEDASAWTALDSIAGSATFDGLTDTTISGIAQGDVVYYNGGAWVNLGPGTAGQVLQTGGAAANPSWSTISGTIADGTAEGNTLRWDNTGSNWVESGVLTNDGTDITLTGRLMPNAHQTLDMGSATAAWQTIYAEQFQVVGSATSFYHDGTDAHLVTDTGNFHFENEDSTTNLGLILKAQAGQMVHLSADVDGTAHMLICDFPTKINFVHNVDHDIHFWDNDTLHKTMYIHGIVEAMEGLKIGRDGMDGQLTIFSEQSGTDYSVVFQPNAAMTETTTYTLPADDGDADQVLKTDGSGALSWTTAASSATFSGLTDTAIAGLASGHIAIYDGTDSWDNKAMSGDIAIASGGATTIQTDAVETAMILNANVTEDKLAASLAFDDGDLLNLSAVNASGTGEGLVLPQATDTSASTAEGQITWDSDDDTLYIGDGAGVQAISGGLWTDGTNGHYDNTEGIIVGGDVAETLDNTGFTLAAGDLFVADKLGVEGNVYTDGSFIAGASLTLTDGSITQSTGSALNVNLGDAAGDDFTIDTTGFVYEGDNDRVGIGTSSPSVELEVNGDVLAHSYDSKLRQVSSGNFETAVVDTEYYSPNQHGGIYGTTYRQYFTTTLPSSLTSGNNVSKLVEYYISYHDGSNRLVARSYTAFLLAWVQIVLSGTSGNNNLTLSVSGWTVIDGWVDYTK